MLYLCLFLLILLLIAVMILFMHPMKLSGISDNTRLLVDAWNSAGDSDSTTGFAPNQEDHLESIPSRGTGANGLADISKFSYQNRYRA